MSLISKSDSLTGLSVEKIIELIRSIRNDLVKEFLNDEFLNNYFQEQYNKPLSKIKREFLKRDLRELLDTPVDLVHYAGLINHIRETGTVFLAERNSDYFYDELKVVIRKYRSN
jgi:hypothetical protein